MKNINKKVNGDNNLEIEGVSFTYFNREWMLHVNSQGLDFFMLIKKIITIVVRHGVDRVLTSLVTTG
jgi:hypothetical protein